VEFPVKRCRILGFEISLFGISIPPFGTCLPIGRFGICLFGISSPFGTCLPIGRFGISLFGISSPFGIWNLFIWNFLSSFWNLGFVYL
jgi:hypothetical protein